MGGKNGETNVIIVWKNEWMLYIKMGEKMVKNMKRYEFSKFF